MNYTRRPPSLFCEAPVQFLLHLYFLPAQSLPGSPRPRRNALTYTVRRWCNFGGHQLRLQKSRLRRSEKVAAAGRTSGAGHRSLWPASSL